MILINSQRSNFEMTPWQKKQAAMLYRFASAEHLKALHKMVSDLINDIVDPLLEKAKEQGRDRIMTDKIWGGRNTSNNWQNSAWPALKDLQVSLAKDIAYRSANQFRVTAVNESLRAIAEYSTDWATENEEENLKLALSAISEHASLHDRTVDEYINQWNDYRMAYYSPVLAKSCTQIPKFNVRMDMQAETGEIPPKTGVYLCLDDQQATLQFVWSEHGGAALRVANTFNDIGNAALAAVGREALWIDDEKMFAFATSAPYHTLFQKSVFLDGEAYPSLAPAAVARSAFTSRSAHWALVEIIVDEFEELDSLKAIERLASRHVERVLGGNECKVSGFYFTPAVPDSRRYFKNGELMPAHQSAYGVTYWQWDESQN